MNMPRTLPWAAGPVTKKSATPGSGIRKRRQSTESSTESECDQGRVATDIKPSHKTVRSSSTSPVPEPPSEEFMKEGLENDDMYIMVEDEFLAIAQTFTRHLHHAEYVRRKNLARVQNAAEIKNLVRPTDMKTVMSNETKKKIEAESASARHKIALEQLKKGAARPPVDSENEEVETEEDRDDDPWVGTSLHNLMTNPRKPQSLMGLHGVKSNTRAALGFPKASQAVPTKRVQNPLTQARTRSVPDMKSKRLDKTTSSDEDDDLDRPSKRPTLAPNKPRWNPTSPNGKNVEPSPARRNTFAEATVQAHQAQVDNSPSCRNAVGSTLQNPRTNVVSRFPNKSRMEKFLDEFDTTEFLPKDKESPRHRSRKYLGSESTSDNRQERDENSRKSRLNEVPTFLV